MCSFKTQNMCAFLSILGLKKDGGVMTICVLLFFLFLSLLIPTQSPLAQSNDQNAILHNGTFFFLSAGLWVWRGGRERGPQHAAAGTETPLTYRVTPGQEPAHDRPTTARKHLL